MWCVAVALRYVEMCGGACCAWRCLVMRGCSWRCIVVLGKKDLDDDDFVDADDVIEKLFEEK